MFSIIHKECTLQWAQLGSGAFLAGTQSPGVGEIGMQNTSEGFSESQTGSESVYLLVDRPTSWVRKALSDGFSSSGQ